MLFMVFMLLKCFENSPWNYLFKLGSKVYYKCVKGENNDVNYIATREGMSPTNYSSCIIIVTKQSNVEKLVYL